MSSGVSIDGLRTLERRLKALPKELKGASSAEGVLAFAIRKGAAIIENEAKHVAPMGETGNLKKSIKKRKVKTQYAATYDIRPDKKIAPYSHIVEFGARSHKVGEGKGGLARKLHGRPPRVRMDPKTGKFYPAVIPARGARPFMRPAWESKRDDAEREIGIQTGRKLDRVAAKLRRIR